MAVRCPNCNRKLTLLDWRQNCPDCGTNLMFHGFEERFYEDAKNAELGSARVRVWWAKVLACFFGGKLQIMRLVFILLPVAALLVPICGIHIELPLYSNDISLGLLGAVSAFGDGTIGAVMSLTGAPVTGEVVLPLFYAAIAFAGAAVSAVLIVLFEILCFLGKKVMSVLLCIASTIGIGFSVYGVFAADGLSKSAEKFETLFTFNRGFGAFVLTAAFIAVLVPNLILVIKGINIKYKEGDLYRVETSKKVRRGEIRLKDLPQPIFETDEERTAREKAIYDTVNGVSPENDKEAEGAVR